MNQHPTSSKAGKLLPHSVAIALMTGALAACSGDNAGEREYSLPGDLCGVSVDQSLYEGLFRPGEVIKITGELRADSPLSECRIDVDDEFAFAVSSFPKEDDFESMAGLGPYELDIAEGEAVSSEYEVLLWPDAVFASAQCAWEGFTDGYTLAIWAPYPNDDKSKNILTDLIDPYMDAAISDRPCEAYTS